MIICKIIILSYDDIIISSYNMKMLSCYNDNIYIMILLYCYDVIIISFSCYHDNVVMISFSCYYDNVIMFNSDELFFQEQYCFIYQLQYSLISEQSTSLLLRVSPKEPRIEKHAIPNAKSPSPLPHSRMKLLVYLRTLRRSGNTTPLRLFRL
jgi:hypothetical protein